LGKTTRPWRARRRLAAAATLVVRILTVAALATAAPDPAHDTAVPLERIATAQTITLKGAVFHVQGLDVDSDHFYLTSVDRARDRAYLHKFTRQGELVDVADITDGPRYHPGGITADATSVWIPVAEYRAHSTTRVMRIDKATLKPVSSFLVKDHIGALTLEPTQKGARIYGANWDAAQVYVWDQTGAALSGTASPTRVAYQDFKFIDGLLVAAGVMNDRLSGAVDWLDPQTLMPLHRVKLARMENGPLWTREGMALWGGKIYFLPADGAQGKAEIYAFPLDAVLGAATACVQPYSGLCIASVPVAMAGS